MKRKFTEYLKQWGLSTHRKPLIVRGARQVGKTYTIREFGIEMYDNLVEVNFEETPEIRKFFNTRDINLIILNLEIYFDTIINPSKTLLFFDEIQSCPEVIANLRYFYEKKPDIHIIVAGSLLDHTLKDLPFPMPVGRVEFAYMYPMTFFEFLSAYNKESLIQFLKSYTLKDEIPQPIHQKLNELLRLYFQIGGMPESISIFIETGKINGVKRIHESILKSFEFDFSKYGSKKQQQILTDLLQYIPRSVGQKFKYSNFNKELKSADILSAINLLSMSRIIFPIWHTNSNTTPLGNGINRRIFKLIFMDIGLYNHILKLPIVDIDIFLDNEGNLAEQYVGQQLLANSSFYTDTNLYYWLREKRGSSAEIDYLTSENNHLIPIEVKSGKTGRLRSLQSYVALKGIKNAIRFNTDQPSVLRVKRKLSIEGDSKDIDFNLISLPLYLVEEAMRITSSYYF